MQAMLFMCREIYREIRGRGGVLGARRWRAGEGEFGRPGARLTTLQIPTSSFFDFLLGKLCLI
eukprot:1158920-Pelagomonas_calceolata.AAC.1